MFVDLIENNSEKFLLFLDESCEEICKSEVVVDIATAGRHCRLSTFYTKSNLFHQSMLGRDAELQMTSSVSIKSARDVRQVKTRSARLSQIRAG